jgi:hypothetical protein
VPLVCEASSFEEAAEKLAEIGDCYEIDYENKYTVVWRVWRLGFPESWRLVGVEVVGEELQGKPTITYSSKYIEGMNMGNGHGLSPKP